MDFKLKTLQVSLKDINLSDIIDTNDVSGREKLTLSNLNISKIDTLSFSCTNVKILDVSHNRISQLSGLFQFPSLITLNISNNLISHLDEIKRIVSRNNILSLNLSSNPIARHPDMVQTIVSTYPKLVKLNELEITDNLRLDFIDAVRLEQKLFIYVSNIFAYTMELKKEICRLKIEYELLQYCKANFTEETGPFWEDINERHLRRLKSIPKGIYLPEGSIRNNIRPNDIIKFIDASERFYSIDRVIEEGEKIQASRSLFKRILINLHSLGSHDLQMFINEHVLSEDFNKGFEFFISLSESRVKSSHISKQLFPVEMTQEENRVDEVFKYFPIFPCNSNYLKAVFLFLREQIQKVEELNIEKEELLSFDSSCLGLPSRVDRPSVNIQFFNRDYCKFDESERLKNSTRENFRYHEYTDAAKVLELSEAMQIIKEKFQKIHQEQYLKAFAIFENLVKVFFLSLVRTIVGYSKWKAIRRREKKKKLNKSKSFFYKTEASRLFNRLKGIYNEFKVNTLRATQYYNGRLVLDAFFVLKKFSINRKKKTLKSNQKKMIERKLKEKVEKEVQQEYNKIISRLTENQSNVKRIWKILNKSADAGICNCGGFKCENCKDVKVKTIKKELKFLKKNIFKSRENKNRSIY